MTDSLQVSEDILNKLFKAVFFQPTPRAREEVRTIIEEQIEDDSSALDCANEVCEYLEIGKRDNRTPIQQVLFPLFGK